MYTLFVILISLFWSKAISADRCYVEVANHALFGNNDLVVKSISSMADCQKKCDEVASFDCISVDYTSLRTCYLSSESHQTNPDMYGPHHGSTYSYVVPCQESEESEENEISEGGSEEGPDSGTSDQCYQVYKDMYLFGEGSDLIFDQTLAECMGLCDNDVSRRCVAINLMSSAACQLLHETHEQIDWDIMFGPFDGVYAMVVDCDAGLPDVVSSADTIPDWVYIDAEPEHTTSPTTTPEAIQGANSDSNSESSEDDEDGSGSGSGSGSGWEYEYNRAVGPAYHPDDTRSVAQRGQRGRGYRGYRFLQEKLNQAREANMAGQANTDAVRTILSKRWRPTGK